jgi:hypothetical protein
MDARPDITSWRISALLRGDSAQIVPWTEGWDVRRVALHVAMILAGAGLYGAAMGWWRAPEQALYVAVKLPLIILLTALGNALLNAMLAPLLGLNIPFRQSFLAILMSFAIASTILGSFSPLLAFLVWNAPAMSPDFRISGGAYSFIMLTQVVVIAFAGIAANVRLLQLLRELGGNARVASRVLFAWLAGNLFLGSQLSWIFRPFIGAPGLEVQFLREHPLSGNFYEAVFRSFLNLLKFD